MRLWIAAAATVVLVGLGLAVAGDDGGTALDRAFSAWVHARFARWLLWVLAAPTEPVLLIAVVAVVALLAARRRDRPAVAVAVLGPGLTAAVAGLALKPAFGRHFADHLAYPSGHLALLCAVLTVLVPLAPRYAVPGALIVVAAAAIALVGLDFHYLTDAVGGLCCGVAVTLTVGVIADRRGAVNRQAHGA